MPSHQDAELILRLYDLRREEKMRTAREWFFKNARGATLEDFHKICPPGSQEHAYFRQVVSYWDMAASFVVAGVIDAELFFQSNRELLFVWTRIQHVVEPIRVAFKDPTAYRNLETVAKHFIEWMNQKSSEMYPAFADRIK